MGRKCWPREVALHPRQRAKVELEYELATWKCQQNRGALDDSPPTARPCVSLTETSSTCAQTPTCEYVGSNPTTTVENPIVTMNVLSRPMRSPSAPKMSAPNGRTANPAPKVARLARNAAVSLSAPAIVGANARPPKNGDAEDQDRKLGLFREVSCCSSSANQCDDFSWLVFSASIPFIDGSIRRRAQMTRPVPHRLAKRWRHVEDFTEHVHFE
jgi:hypothetical protein